MPKQVMFECPHCARPVHFEDGTEEAVCPSCDAHFKLNLHEQDAANSPRAIVTTIIITLFLAAIVALFIVRMFPSNMDPQFDTRGDTVESDVHF